MRVVLGSQSPARLKTLENAGIEPIVIVSSLDEDAVLNALPGGRFGQGGSTTPAQEVVALAHAKCQAVCQLLTSDTAPSPAHTDLAHEDHLVVIGCDSMLEINGRMVGKPHTPDVARLRIQEMRHTQATLWTGHAVALLTRASLTQPWTVGPHVKRAAQTLVRFGDISDAEIDAYVASGEPLEVAGSFTVDGLGGAFITGVDGDFHSVVGISLPLVRTMVTQLGVFWPDLWTPDVWKSDKRTPNVTHTRGPRSAS